MPYLSDPRACFLSHFFAVDKFLVTTIGYLFLTSPRISFATATLMSSTFFMRAEIFSARNDLIETERCNSSLYSTLSSNSIFLETFIIPYSLSLIFGEIYTCQSLNERVIASTHSPIPASPVLISCPPPTRQTTTAQSVCLFKQEIKNSGSDWLNPGRCFFLSIKLAVWVKSQAR